ncbi:hypothetical protein C4D60_Mb03t05050 [Musa balbisiana]|uniref:Uncharacterized protein n=1 Tax=Musa balbisiana TaxID=52838 RepID=A0A4S8J7L6_MUSBA|nr:hypothetical protein C4D60_Mb03t05050 [Musa balbisiana]
MAFVLVGVVFLLLFLVVVVVCFLHRVGGGEERRQRRADEGGVGGPPHLARHEQPPALVEGVLGLHQLPRARHGRVRQARERLGLPREEVGQASPATNPFLFLAASTSFPSSCPSPWRRSGRLTWSFSPTLGSTRDDILLFFSSFLLRSGASC